MMAEMMVALLASSAPAVAKPGHGTKPWLEAYSPTKIEWAAIEIQAAEADTEFGEDGVTVYFYLGPQAYSEGVISCDIDYLSGTPKVLVEKRELGIRKRFERRRSVPGWEWLRLEMNVREATAAP